MQAAVHVRIHASGIQQHQSWAWTTSLGLGCWYPDTFQIYLADKIHLPASLAGGWQGAVGMPDCPESLFDRHRGIQIPRGQTRTVELELMDNFSFHKPRLTHKTSQTINHQKQPCKTASFFAKPAFPLPNLTVSCAPHC